MGTIEPNPKIAQAYMGHKKFDTTMNIYTEVQERAKKEEVKRIQGKIYIK